jgi:RNA-directed DNA polymerase
MCGRSLRENRETSVGSNRPRLDGRLDDVGKVNSRTPIEHTTEESDDAIVPKTPANQETAVSAEWAEARASTKRNSKQNAVNRMQGRPVTSNGLQRVRQRAEADKSFRFNNLFHFLKIDLLRESFYQLKRDAAPGIDGITWSMYERTLETTLPDLQERLHKGSYRAKPVKRAYLTKDDGRLRPIGITSIEDKVVQQACVTILNEVFEPLFIGFSYGYRPGRSQHDALDALHEGIIRRKINWILETDLEGFFDSLDHAILMDIVQTRVTDKRLLRLIRKWLKVGWFEDGQRHAADKGSAQGSVISPLLANIFLNAAMDQWFLHWRTTQAQGDVIMVRFADDAVLGFQDATEGRVFLNALRERLERFKLTLQPRKTRLIEFGRFAASNRRERGKGKPETFNFLGFTHSCSTTRRGTFCIRRQTIAKRLRRKLQEVKAELVRRMHDPLECVGAWLGSVVRGFTNYHGVPGNTRRIRAFYTQIGWLWHWAIRRRSHKARKRWTLDRFYRLQRRWIPRPRIVHPYPSIRFDAKYSR